MSDRATLKNYFQTGDIPTQGHFAELIDSMKVVADTEPWVYPISIFKEFSLNTAWQELAQFLIPRPLEDWLLEVVALLGSDQDLELQILDTKDELLFTLDWAAQIVGLSGPFQVVDLSQLQSYGSFCHLVIRARTVPGASLGTISLKQLVFSSHP